jgi:hypothetical protein
MTERTAIREFSPAFATEIAFSGREMFLAWSRNARRAVPNTLRKGGGGVAKDVTFIAEAEATINDQIDAAYRTKYRRHGGRYVDPIVAPTARATTMKLVPH